MANVEVDVKLFVTCRLCIENVGVYLIDPCVQQEIKDCYDITIPQYDSLSQLICRPCGSMLQKHGKMKKIFLHRQQVLLKKKAAFDEFKRQMRSSNISQDTLSSVYDKWFTCRWCNESRQTKRGMIKHVKTHRSLLHKYRTYIDKDCSVYLKKTDNLPNIFNSEKIVVHNITKCISSDNEFYYIVYKPKRVNDCSCDEVNTLKDSNAGPSTDMVCIENSTKKKKDTDLSQQETLSPTNTIPEKHPGQKKIINVTPRQHSMQLRKRPKRLLENK